MKHTSLLLTLLLLIFASCSTEDSSTPLVPDTPQLTAKNLKAASAYNRFGFALFQELAQNTTKNTVVSPMSVSYALGMTMNGTDGETYSQMRNALQFSGLSDTEINESYKTITQYLTTIDANVTVNIANSIWHRYGFTIIPDFIHTNNQYFDAPVHALDFDSPDAASIINSWVATKTENRIDEIVDSPINTDVLMYLINAMYFKGTWKYEFDPANTMDGIFHNADGSQTDVQMMNMECDLPYAETTHYSMLELPYGNGNYSMIVILPKPQTELQQLVDEFDANTWDAALSALEEKTVSISMPKFTLEYEQSIPDALKSLGIQDAFTEQANFTRMANVPGIYISDVRHKTWLSVDEAGTEAAAVTSVEVILTSAGIAFTMNQPFLFGIREQQSGTVLFLGRVNSL